MPFELQPLLNGTLLLLRPLKSEDFSALFEVASDPLIWEQHPEKDRYTETVFRQFFEGALRSGGAFVVIDAKTNQVIGSSRYFGYDEATSEVEIGWTFLARSYWGGVYNKEMKALMIRHALKFVKSVIFIVGPANIRSQKAMEKIGAALDGRREVRGKDCIVYRIRGTATTSSPS